VPKQTNNSRYMLGKLGLAANCLHVHTSALMFYGIRVRRLAFGQLHIAAHVVCNLVTTEERRAEKRD
jgi:hypothetical protein